MSRGAPLAALTAFHLRVGSRLAMRALVPFSAILVARIGTDAEPGRALGSLARSTAGHEPAPAVAAALVLSAITVAAWAAPRLTAGLAGWSRHLPASSTAHRRAALIGLALAQAPILGSVLLLGAGLALAEGAGAISATRLAGLPLLALGAATSALPVRRRALALTCGTGAALLAVGDDPLALLVAAAILALSDRTAGVIDPRREARLRGRGAAPGALPYRVALRALRWRVAGTFPAALVPVAASALFLANNTLPGPAALLAARLGGGLAVVFLLAGLAQALSVRRPAWPWVRSLPWTSRSRIRVDALLLGSLALPVALLPVLLSAGAILVTLPLVPLLSLRAASALRTSAATRTGAAGRLLFEGSLLAGLTALVPWLAIAALALVPFAARSAAESDRRMKPSRWAALHHLADGDPLSWSAR